MNGARSFRSKLVGTDERRGMLANMGPMIGASASNGNSASSGSGSSGQSTRRLSLARPVSAGLSHSKQPDDLFWRVGEHYPHYQEPDARCLQLDAADDGGLKLLL